MFSKLRAKKKQHRKRIHQNCQQVRGRILIPLSKGSDSDPFDPSLITFSICLPLSQDNN